MQQSEGATYREVIESNNLRDLEQDKEPKKDKQVAPPEVCRMDVVASVDVGLATDVVLAAIGAVERASLVGTETIADERSQLKEGSNCEGRLTGRCSRQAGCAVRYSCRRSS